ncbi:MAG: phosphotransferase, partial [Polyangiales bacterium]
DDVAARLAGIDRQAKPALVPALGRIERALDEAQRHWPVDPPQGVIHGDLFRDNVRWAAKEGREDDRIVALIDWESASHGAFVYDLMVCVLSWCYGDRFEWNLARAMARAYDAERGLTEPERGALRVAGLAAAVRFTTTRITDFHLREGIGDRVVKDYRRFLARIDALSAMTSDELATRLLG